MYEVYGIKCNELINPRGIDTPRPVFSWRFKSDKKNTFQVSYEIAVFDENGSSVWFEKKESDKNYAIKYSGESLKTGKKYFWNIKSYNNYGEVAVSNDNYFVMGIMENAFWKAKWIEATQVRKEIKDIIDSSKIFSGEIKSKENQEEYLTPPVCLEKEYHIEKKVKKAMAFATARGIYELSIDGNVVSEPLVPGYTAYHKYLEYQVYDVTKYFSQGKHKISTILADGWFTGKIGLMGVGNQYGNTNAFLMQIEVEYEDGTCESIITDKDFLWKNTQYQYADIFVGEKVDYTFEEEIEECNVIEVDYGYENLVGCASEPVRVLKSIKPVEYIISPTGEMILDVGENIVGYTSFKIDLDSDSIITLEHSEVLDKNGNFLQNIMGQNKNQKDIIICKKGKNEYTPKFTFHGFRYVKVTGLSKEIWNNLKKEEFEICIIGTDLEKTGGFVTSNKKLNILQENIFRSQQGNMLSIPTDCPQRERAGWTGDMQVYMDTASFNMDVYAFLQKWLTNMRLEQLDDGQIPNVVPTIDSNKYIDGEGKKHICSAGWGDACVIIPYKLYKAYGDKKVLHDNYSMMCKWMKYVENQANTSLPRQKEEYSEEELNRQRFLWNTDFHFGDWLIPSIIQKTHNPMQTAILTKELVATAMYAYTTNMMIEINTILEKYDEAKRYTILNKNIREAFSKEYVNDEGIISPDLQGMYVLALAMDMVEDEKKDKCADRLVALIRENGECLDTGFLSVPFLLDVLVENNKRDEAYKILYQENCPSWLYEVKMGATTIWENWSAIMPDGTRTNSSYNHFAFGCVGDFMYRNLAGINIEEPGYRKVKIAPDFNCKLENVKAFVETRYGKVEVIWKKNNGLYNIQITLPPNTEGIVELGDKVMEIGNGRYEFKILA